MFCPNCDSILVPLNEKGDVKALKCLDCDYSSEEDANLDNFVIKEELERGNGTDKIEVLEEIVEYGGISKDIREELREQYREAMDGGSS